MLCNKILNTNKSLDILRYEQSVPSMRIEKLSELIVNVFFHMLSELTS